MTLEFSPLHANTPSIVLTARAASAGLEEGITLQVRSRPFRLLSLTFIGLGLTMTSARIPNPILVLAHPTRHAESKVSS